MVQCSNCSTIAAAEAPAYLATHPEVVLLDVRNADEVAAGRVQGSIHIDVQSPDFVNKDSKLDKSKTYMVHCMSGYRSATACEHMVTSGFSNLINVDGGYNEWPTK